MAANARPLVQSDAERKAEIRSRLEEARVHTLQLLHPVTDADLLKQHSTLMSPLVWDLAHIGNFEELWLVQALGEQSPINPAFDEMYDAFKNPRRDRPTLPLLDRQGSEEYLALVRSRALRQLEDAMLSGPDPLTRDGYVFEMVLQHEYQHDETMLATLQLMSSPGYLPPLPPTLKGAQLDDRMVLVDEGACVIGNDDRSVAYDNERSAHQVYLPSYWIDAGPVSNGAYREFVEDRGYERPELWSGRGQEWLTTSAARAPQFWEQRAGVWLVDTFGHLLPLNPRQPVQHVCYYEAEAFARWCGKRLPTEAEWEKAASWDPGTQRKLLFPWGDEPPTADRVNLDQLSYAPMEIGAYPAGVSPYGCHQMIGDVWEWVDSSFTSYPGFEAWPYREYSEVFFGDEYRVLRGGSWAVRPGAIRNTFRNWDYPIRRQIFSGFRCARDAR